MAEFLEYNSDQGHHGHRTLGFSSQADFKGTNDYISYKSNEFKLPRVEKPYDIWKIPPPDLTPVAFEPKPPKRNTRDSMQPWRWDTFGESNKNRIRSNPPMHRLLLPPRVRSPQFRTRFHRIDPREGQNLFVKHGQFPHGKFVDQSPHDFRQYPPIQTLGLPEFDRDYEKDPRDLKLKCRTLHCIFGLEPPPDERLNVPSLKTHKRAEVKWDSNLIMPNDRFPQKSGAYTRFRRKWRHPHSAFLDRVEEQLNKKWNKGNVE